jgi:Sec-independent protein translocase protein TatA
MIESSKDILLIVLAFCVLWFTIFLCWAIYYVAMILREVKKMMTDVRNKFELVDKILMTLKEKLEHTSSYMKLFVDTAVNITQFLKDRKMERGDKGKKKK